MADFVLKIAIDKAESIDEGVGCNILGILTAPRFAPARCFT
jgi:hypothetical protein